MAAVTHLRRSSVVGWSSAVVLLAAAFCWHGQLANAALPDPGFPILEPTWQTENVTFYELHVTLAKGGPDCFEREVILVNGVFQPNLIVRVNDTLKIELHNDLPKSFPQIADGITLHCHGFSMWDNASWYDGVPYVTQCPTEPGDKMTYNFKVDESPGFYTWHDHSTANRADGLTGGILVVDGHHLTTIWDDYNLADQQVLFITDWWHTEANVLAMQVNRPYDSAKADNMTGRFVDVGPPDALLINGKGFYGDCNMYPADPSSAMCSVPALVIPPGKSALQPWASQGNPGCSHEVLTVTPGSSHMIHINNAAAQAYVTVCFEGHTVTVLTADGIPTEEVDLSCLDVNSGQKYTVLLVADQEPRDYWITVQAQYARAAIPNGYGVIHYATPDGAAASVPPTPAPQPGDVEPWSHREHLDIMTNEGVMGYIDNYDLQSFWNLYVHRGMYTNPILYKDTADHTIIVNTTMPVMSSTGSIKYALNNVAMPSSQPCTCLKDKLVNDPSWLSRHLVTPDYDGQTGMLNITYGKPDAKARVYTDTMPVPSHPVVGWQVVSIKMNDTVDIIINNLPSDSMNGEYRENVTRPWTEQHPFHLHGHRFFILGMGPGEWDPSMASEPGVLNTFNPMLRDTVTLLPRSWAYIRFFANNPGIWPFHCHIMWHSYMGQQLYLAEAVDHLPATPKGINTKCRKNCLLNFAPFNEKMVEKKWGRSGYRLPKDRRRFYL